MYQMAPVSLSLPLRSHFNALHYGLNNRLCQRWYADYAVYLSLHYVFMELEAFRFLGGLLRQAMLI